MDKQSLREPDSDGGKRAVTQLVQIKYILTGILGLAVFGRSGDLNTNLFAVAATLSFVYSVETTCAWIPGTASRLASIHRRRKAAAAESAQRMRKLLRELEEAERQVRNE
ncbi:MAG: hypothetical protein JNK74_20660 [Candidatus Hydrogenedentes bacterium]|nr:hypothetical protein [Candidatus Hydrogenedentota bacterium]